MEYLAVIIAYLMGSISFGYIFCKGLKGGDIREIGSGSTGATNISRVLGFGPALLIFILDALKGISALYLTQVFTDSPYLVILAGIAVVAGHNWPVFFGFRGGRGIATSLGVLIGISPLVVLGLLLVGAFVIAVTRYVSLGSVMGALSLPLLMWYFGLEVPYIVFGSFMTVMALVRHIPNLKRLREGKESKIGDKVK